MSVVACSSRRVLLAAAPRSVQSCQLHTRPSHLASTAPPHSASHGSAHSDSHDGYDPHKLFNPPYNKAVPLSILAFCTFGAASVITGCIMYQQKKGGFWFKKKQSDK